jgi:hypothetical protein
MPAPRTLSVHTSPPRISTQFSNELPNPASIPAPVPPFKVIGTINEKVAAKARNTLLLGLKSAQITVFRQKLNGYCPATRKQTQRIKELQDQIRDMRMSSTPDPFETSIDRIFTDLNQNREQAPSRR